MKKIKVACACLIGLSILLILTGQAFAANKHFFLNLQDNVEQSIYTVPSGKKFLLKSVVVTNHSAVEFSRVDIYTGGDRMITSLQVPGPSTYSHNFESVVIKGGETLVIIKYGTETTFATVTGLVK